MKIHKQLFDSRTDNQKIAQHLIRSEINVFLHYYFVF